MKQLTEHARVHDVSGLPALIRVPVIIFVIICRTQSSSLLSFVGLSHQFNSVTCLYVPLAVKI